jgi:hypothetical protein
MANPTTNFGWQMPTSTDLVTDLPADFEVFGQAVDTALVDLKGGTTGQVLSKASNTNMDFTWVTTDDANAIQNTIVDAKGDLISATGSDVPARLAVGANGETLVADSSTSTGLRYNANYAAGKNTILNGDFNIWQRGTSFSITSNAAYTADRWVFDTGGSGVVTVSRQAFTAGQTDVPGNPTYFLQAAFGTSGSSATMLQQRIENVATFAGQAVTYSMWAKVSSGTAAFQFQYVQDFGSGGSSAVSGFLGNFTLTTSWQRISATVTLPSISGKTIGTNSNLVMRISPMTSGTVTYSFANAQLEAGSVATAFQTATGTIQGELAACQRYYQRLDAATAEPLSANGGSLTTTISQVEVVYPVVMRSAPSSLDASNVEVLNYGNNTAYTGGTLAINLSTKSAMQLRYTHGTAVFTAGNVVHFRSSAGTGFIGWSAEL